MQYSRPMYSYVDGTGNGDIVQIGEGDGLALVYSGLRWQALQLPGFNREDGRKFWQWQVGMFADPLSTFHAFVEKLSFHSKFF